MSDLFPIISVKEQTEKQALNLIVFLLRTQSNSVFDCVTGARWLGKAFGLHIDHHAVSSALDYMVRTGQADILQPGGFATYRIATIKGD